MLVDIKSTLKLESETQKARAASPLSPLFFFFSHHFLDVKLQKQGDLHSCKFP
jgi:hypothetical protein